MGRSPAPYRSVWGGLVILFAAGTTLGDASVDLTALGSTGMQLASLGATGLNAGVNANVKISALTEPDVKIVPFELVDGCAVDDECIDDYLWSLYERTPKVDTIKQHESVKVTVTRKGKTKTVTKTVTKLVDNDFGWKDPRAADVFGLPLKDYVIGGVDPSFKRALYPALRAMDDAGLLPGITSAFRDDYRQSIASGLKAASNRSYHGGSLRGGYGHGLAVDLVSVVVGGTRSERWAASEKLWKWIDAHGKDFGIGRPYLDHDPPHVGPIAGPEYIAKRGITTTKPVGLATTHPAGSKAKTGARTAAAHATHGKVKRARTARSAKTKSG